MLTAIMIVIAVIFVLIVGIIIYILKTYNGLVTLRNKVRNQKSQIDIQLKTRFDLIPNLVETVKGYAKHEHTALEDVIKARNTYTTAGNDTAAALKAEDALSGALTKLFALSEAYPELKANNNFMSLQNDLKDIEKKINFSRQFYNDSVFMLNNKIEMFPTNLLAGMFGFEQETFFEAKEEERENVKVSF